MLLIRREQMRAMELEIIAPIYEAKMVEYLHQLHAAAIAPLSPGELVAMVRRLTLRARSSGLPTPWTRPGSSRWPWRSARSSAHHGADHPISSADFASLIGGGIKDLAVGGALPVAARCGSGNAVRDARGRLRHIRHADGLQRGLQMILQSGRERSEIHEQRFRTLRLPIPVFLAAAPARRGRPSSVAGFF